MLELPPGYVQRREGRASLISSERDLPILTTAVCDGGTLHAYAAAHAQSKPLPGRGTVYAIPAGDAWWVVRHYQRGGAIAGLLGDRYLAGGATRPEAELIVSEAARARGIATPRIAAAVVYDDGVFYRADIATEYIANAQDLAVLSMGARQWPMEERVAAWRAAGALLLMCFTNGLLHPDLNLKNILIERKASGLVAHVIDLDKARLTGSASTAQRARMLARLERSREKIENKTGRSITAEEKQAMHEGLTG